MEAVKKVKVTLEIFSGSDESPAVTKLESEMAALPSELAAKKQFTKPQVATMADYAMKSLMDKFLRGLTAFIFAFLLAFGVNAQAETLNHDQTAWSAVGVGAAGVNGERFLLKSATTSLNCAAAAGTCTATNLIPAGSLVVGVVTRVTTLFAGCTSLNIGDGTDPDKFGAGTGITAGTTTGLADETAATPALYASATSVVLTAVGGATDFSAGVMRITVFYFASTSPTS